MTPDADTGPAAMHAHPSPPDVTVAICTYRRAHIVETVRSVLGQARPDGLRVEIVVVDDDPAGSARAAVAAIAAASPAAMPVRYVACGTGNVASARNACLDAAAGEFIAFIDDDEIARPGWLAGLIAAQRIHAADVVKGAVAAVYPDATPAWLRAADPFARDYGPTGATPRLLATGNVLFRRALVAAGGIRFDARFGRTGGEDTDFFGRVRAAGARIVASREAVVDEIVPPERITTGYLSARARRMGQVEARKARLGTGGDGLLRSAGVALAWVALLWPNALLRPLAPRAAYKTFFKFWYSIGILEGAAFARSDEMT